MEKDPRNCECGGDCDGSCENNEDEQQMMPGQFDEETRAQIQEIQILEQNFEQLMQQKHLFNMEINETSLALNELDKSEGEIFKLVGNQLIIKTTKEKMASDLNHKKDLLETRMKNIEGQEKDFAERLEELRKEIMRKISPGN